jgi:DNA-binding winged helix-turn-helix (wHTH) protein/TolB-like protein
MTTAAEPPAGVDLAQEADFRLGAMSVSPSACRVRVAGQEQRIEPRVMEVLVVFARNADHTVTRDQLIDACWGGRIVSDDAVTRVVAQVRNLARSFDPAPYVLETVSKVGFRLIASDAVEASTDARPTATPRSGPTAVWRRPAAIVAALVAVILVAAGGWLLWRAMAPGGGVGASGQNGRVEVVRFEARQPDPALQRLSAELCDSLIRVLTRAGINTAPRVASRGDGTSAGNAEFRIAGSVDREGDIYVVNAQIVDRRSGMVLLSMRLERPVAAAAEFGQEAALGISAGLYSALEDRKWANRRMDPVVFALYLNTCDALIRDDSPARMVETARRLVRAAPDLAIGHAMYGIAQAQMAVWKDHAPDEAEALRRGARASAERAIKLEPRTPKAYLAMAISYPDGTHFAEREANLRRARQIDPNLNPGRISYVQLLRELGRLDEALETASLASASGDPRMRSILIQMAFMDAQKGDLAAAEAALRDLDLGNPEAFSSVRWIIAVSWEDPAIALKKVRLPGSGVSPAEVTCMETYLAGLARTRASGGRGLPPACAGAPSDWKTRMLSREGDVDGAYAAFATPRLASRSGLYFLYYPEMKAFRADPRFMPLAKRLGLVDYWVKSNRWPDFCAEPDLPYDCRAVARSL